jgi:hypothetical protein
MQDVQALQLAISMLTELKLKCKDAHRIILFDRQLGEMKEKLSIARNALEK